MIYILYNENFSLKKNLNKSYYSILAGVSFSLGTLIFLYALKYGKNMPSVRLIGIVFEMIFILMLSCLFLQEKIKLTNYGIIITLIGVS